MNKRELDQFIELVGINSVRVGKSLMSDTGSCNNEVTVGISDEDEVRLVTLSKDSDSVEIYYEDLETAVRFNIPSKIIKRIL